MSKIKIAEDYIRLANRIAVGFVALLILATIVPSKDTMYKMAASEVGEIALDNGGLETLQNLKKFIDKKLETALQESPPIATEKTE